MFVKVKMIAGVALAAALVAAHSSESADRVRYYRVQPGDTLWSIAEAKYEGDVRARVWQLQRANAVDPGTLRVGQRLVLP